MKRLHGKAAATEWLVSADVDKKKRVKTDNLGTSEEDESSSSVSNNEDFNSR